MERRDFLRMIALALLTSHAPPRRLLAAPQPTVAVARGKRYEETTRRALGAVGGMKRFVRPGGTVVIKPNMGWDRTPAQGANTHPLVVRALAMEAIAAGASKVKVFDRSCNDERRCHVQSGIRDALKDLNGVELKFIDEERFRKVPIPGGVAIREWELYEEALTADLFINVPVAKHHALSKLTLGLKNVMGVMGGDRGSTHRHLSEALVDLNIVVRSHLTVIDATRILTAHGPQGGNLDDVRVLDTVIASTDIVAADAYATTLFGMKPDAIPSTVAAFRRGLGEMRTDRIRIVTA